MAKRLIDCECADPQCPCKSHIGNADYRCLRPAGITLRRIDMEDYSGARFCAECGEDALSSGLFVEA